MISVGIYYIQYTSSGKVVNEGGGLLCEKPISLLVEERRVATVHVSRRCNSKSTTFLLWNVEWIRDILFTFRIIRVQDEKCSCVFPSATTLTHEIPILTIHWRRCARIAAVAMNTRMRVQVWNYFGNDTTYCTSEWEGGSTDNASTTENIL